MCLASSRSPHTAQAGKFSFFSEWQSWQAKDFLLAWVSRLGYDIHPYIDDIHYTVQFVLLDRYVVVLLQV